MPTEVAVAAPRSGIDRAYCPPFLVTDGKAPVRSLHNPGDDIVLGRCRRPSNSCSIIAVVRSNSSTNAGGYFPSIIARSASGMIWLYAMNCRRAAPSTPNSASKRSLDKGLGKFSHGVDTPPWASIASIRSATISDRPPQPFGSLRAEVRGQQPAQPVMALAIHRVELRKAHEDVTRRWTHRRSGGETDHVEQNLANVGVAPGHRHRNP